MSVGQSYLLKLITLQLICMVALALHPQRLTNSGFEIDSMYQFGDSISDTGNDIRENPHTLCTSFPYGESYFKFATGRCSDGLVMADYYATAFGLEFLNPYLERDANFSNGVDFSVLGATALDISYLESKNITISSEITNSSLNVQLAWFRDHLRSICSSPSECKNKLQRSIIFMEAIGGNDYIFSFGDGLSFQDAYQLVPDVIREITDVIKELIHLGAVRVVVPGIVPNGCLPSTLVKFNSSDPTMYDELGCVKDWNKLCKFHNSHLLNATKELQKTYPNVTLIFADYYYAMRRVLKNAASLGFEEDKLLVACCGGGKNPYNFDLSEVCGKIGVPVCPKPNKRVMWDGFHFTQQFYEYVSKWMLENTIIPGLTHTSSM